ELFFEAVRRNPSHSAIARDRATPDHGCPDNSVARSSSRIGRERLAPLRLKPSFGRRRTVTHCTCADRPNYAMTSSTTSSSLVSCATRRLLRAWLLARWSWSSIPPFQRDRSLN